jgi:medium-chain acyl-[acyl-carrier-protein] hydrolase
MTTPSIIDPWIVRPKPNPQAHLRLFCFPYAGGGALVFRTWPDDLPPDVEVCAVQLPGRESRLKEPLFTRLSPLVQTLSHVLEPHLDVPFAFFGHSVGTLVSFELARQFRRQNAPGPVHLFVSGRWAPQLPDPYPPIHQLPESEFVEELRRFNGTPELVLQHAELMALLLPILRADFEINETYVYTAGEPLDCPISAYGGLQDARASREGLEGWRVHTRGDFVLRVFPGDHFFLHSARSLVLQTLSRELTQLLRQIARG